MYIIIHLYELVGAGGGGGEGGREGGGGSARLHVIIIDCAPRDLVAAGSSSVHSVSSVQSIF